MSATTCIVCGGRPELWCRKLERDVFRCGGCGHITVPAGMMRDARGASIYESDETIFSVDGNADYYFDNTNTEAARGKLSFVEAYSPAGGRLLDVGASFGHFLSEARTRFQAAGIEVSPSAVEWAKRTFDVDVAVGSIYELRDRASDEGAYDVVTCWDVLEHLEDPVSAVDRLFRSLAPGGRLFLSTPDAGALIARVMGPKWHYLDPVQHLNLFSRANLVRLLTSRGFRMVGRRHFGRGYRVDYIANRLRYLAFGPPANGRPMRVPLGRLTVPIKLWDVMGLVLEVDVQ
jgi:SAM-dependent methyltransferase